MALSSKQQLVLAIQQHRYFVLTLCAYITEETETKGIYRIVENLSYQQSLDEYGFAPQQLNAIRLTQEISDTALAQFFTKGKKTSSNFFDSLESDKAMAEYVANYVERRIAKGIATAETAQIPLFRRENNTNQFYASNMLHIASKPIKPMFRFELLPEELRYTIQVMHNGKPLRIEKGKSEVITTTPCLIRVKNWVFGIDGIDGNKISPFTSKEYIAVPKNTVGKYMESFVLNTIKNQDIEAIGFVIHEVQADFKATLSIDDRLMGGKCIVPIFDYGNKQHTPNDIHTPIVTLKKADGGSYIFTKTRRNTEREGQMMQILTNVFGLKKTVGGAEMLPNCTDANSSSTTYDVIEWVNSNSQKLSEHGFIVLQTNTNFYLDKVSISLSAKAEQDWFDLHGTVQLQGFELPFISLRRNILRDIREYTLPNGQVLVLPEAWFTRYKPIMQMSREDNKQLKVPKSLINMLIDSNIDAPDALKINKNIADIARQKVEIPRHLNATLRNYQKVGFAWLSLIARNGINGCLADDMGLGKTLQAIALLQSVKEQGDESTSLVVVPTSLVHNWKAEISKYAPQLKALVYTGASRKPLMQQFTQNNIVITTYGTLRNDIEELRDLHFNYLILDESQYIKNPASKTYRAAILLNARHNLSLSGTPIENSLMDLWAQMNFLNRGMLGSLRNFRNEFQIPIEKHDNPNKKQQLKRIIEPLIMRRSKEDVAKDLPPIAEQIVECEMSDSQRETYEKEKSAIRNSILSNIDSEGIAKSTMHILSGLTRLRQIANHPALLPDYAGLDSGKFDEITQRIENVIAEGHKILVFSSFVKHLEQIRTFIEQQGIGYEMLTGASTNRSDAVENFQSSTDKKVFLISLKAGGVGLNLTAADYVFVLDPWWNPASEMQAAARAHRIGQDKNVFVYRFISRGTVEEKIINMQSRKEQLAQLFVEGSNPMKYLDKELVMELLE